MTSRRTWRWASAAAAAAILSALVWRLGTGPFLDGLRAVDARALVAAAVLGALTTACSAWRWKIVARGLQIDLPLSGAFAAYYRSVFLNVALPGGVVGDLHRGISHGRAAGDVGRGLRSVVWERAGGQVVQAVLTVAVLIALPSPVQPVMPLVAIALLVVVAGLAVVARARSGDGRSRWSRVRAAASRDIRKGLLAGRAWLAISLLSALVVTGHAVTFLIAARAAGTTAPLSTMVPLALLVLAAMALPNVGGWGPREGVAAWAFGAAGLGAEQGVATTVAYGVMVFAAGLPGAVVLAAAWLRRTGAGGRLEPAVPSRAAAAVRSDRAADA